MKIEAMSDKVAYEIRDGILHSCFLVSHLDLESAKDAVKERHVFTEGISYPSYVDTSNVISTTKEARDYLIGEEASRNITAMAFYIDSPVGKIITSFFLKIKKPPYPLKIFSSKEKAIEWLQTFNG